MKKHWSFSFQANEHTSGYLAKKIKDLDKNQKSNIEMKI